MKLSKNELKKSGQNLRGLLNDLKRRPQDAANQLGFSIEEIEEYISTTPITAAETMINCFDTARGVGGPGSPACTSIGRDADGRLNRIFRGYRNLGLHEVRGWDLNVDYGFSLLSGYVDLNYFCLLYTSDAADD